MAYNVPWSDAFIILFTPPNNPILRMSKLRSKEHKQHGHICITNKQWNQLLTQPVRLQRLFGIHSS